MTPGDLILVGERLIMDGYTTICVCRFDIEKRKYEIIKRYHEVLVGIYLNTQTYHAKRISYDVIEFIAYDGLIGQIEAENVTQVTRD